MTFRQVQSNQNRPTITSLKTAVVSQAATSIKATTAAGENSEIAVLSTDLSTDDNNDCDNESDDEDNGEGQQQGLT